MLRFDVFFVCLVFVVCYFGTWPFEDATQLSVIRLLESIRIDFRFASHWPQQKYDMHLCNNTIQLFQQNTLMFIRSIIELRKPELIINFYVCDSLLSAM